MNTISLHPWGATLIIYQPPIVSKIEVKNKKYLFIIKMNNNNSINGIKIRIPNNLFKRHVNR